jgi:spermidine synthase
MPNDQTDLHKQQSKQKQSATLIYAAFIAGLCSIIYELLIATTVSYFMGDSVKFFSLTIGYIWPQWVLVPIYPNSLRTN